MTAVPDDAGDVVTPGTDVEAPHRTSRRSERTQTPSPGRAKLIAGIVAGVVVLAVLADVAVSWGRIHPGVRIGDVAVGAMKPAEAREAIDEAFERSSEAPVVVKWDDKEFKITAASIGARLDETASVAAAMAVGRADGLPAAIWARVSALFGGVGTEPVVLLDDEGTAAQLDKIDKAAAVPATDATLKVRGLSVEFEASSAGRGLDRDATRNAIVGALVSGSHSVAAVVTTVTPFVTDADAQAVLQVATRMISGPVTVKLEGASLVIPRTKVAGWLVFSGGTQAAGESTLAPVALSASFDATRIAPAITALTSERARPAKNASFVTEGGKVRIVPGQVGSGPDLPALAADLKAACEGAGTRTAVLKLTEKQPKITTAAAKAMGIVDRISSYTTSYSTANPARTNNVHLLAKALDGKLIAPGAVFSFNGAAGKRTAAKGYQEAPAIVKGKLVPQLGGGVCQVGTTVFNAVFFSGLPVVERHNHSFYISHYPKGRDATVSWGYPDFKFRNDTDHWVLVRTSTTASTLTVALYGTDPGYDVKYTTGPFTDIVPHKTVETPDPTLKKGRRIVEDGGVDGSNVTVVRTVTKNGVVVRKDTFVSHYSPKIEVVRVGTKKSTTATGTVTP